MTNPNSELVTQEIKISDIKVRGQRRSLNAAKVDELVESISLQGLRTPITVWATHQWGKEHRSELRLIAGLHRLEAMMKLGFKTIPCVVIKGDPQHVRLWEISENLHRADLTALEYDEHVADWVDLIEDHEAISRQNVEQRALGRPMGRISKAAHDLPVDGKTVKAKRKNIERALKVANIDVEAKKVAKKAGLDQNRTALLKIAAEKGSAAQVAKARKLADDKVAKEKSIGPRKVRHRGMEKRNPLSAADKKKLRRLNEGWQKYLKPAFDKASSKVRELFIADIRRAPK